MTCEIGKDAFHLVVHDALDPHRAVLRFQIEVPSFLTERVWCEQGKEHRVAIHVNEVEEIGLNLARHGIDGLVRIREGVEKRLERAFQEFLKRVLERKRARSAQHRMFEDMRCACAVGHGGPKCN